MSLYLPTRITAGSVSPSAIVSAMVMRLGLARRTVQKSRKHHYFTRKPSPAPSPRSLRQTAPELLCRRKNPSCRPLYITSRSDSIH